MPKRSLPESSMPNRSMSNKLDQAVTDERRLADQQLAALVDLDDY